MSRFLLYIDILGFSEMTRAEPRKVARVYSILDTLNAHHQTNFSTIVFSDTILVYNTADADTDHAREDCVWLLTEFAEDLHHRLTGQDIYFRAVLVEGDFTHYKLDNVECFFGGALIDAHNAEKGIPSLGLFMSTECVKYNRFFRTAPFSDEFEFVYLNRSLETLNKLSTGRYPFDLELPGDDYAPYVPWQVRFLKDVYVQMRSHKSPLVRVKFLTAWDFYYKRYPEMLQALIEHNFDLSALGPAGTWKSLEATMESDIKYFKRIGSGTPLSMALTKNYKKKKSPPTKKP
ncbi:hypothetical protein J1G18_07535 [Pseudomonas sp. MIS38]|uniref:hypothetical protein n=1 Tax=Pseudomonas sp. MIS38 TaxID=91465 RepID=UPI001CA642C4|nr:hypothetical protein [Pseudomonas sp. MIS38]MBY8957134.1 hypothetical protein [Pseudomonas sp. MIS38]